MRIIVFGLLVDLKHAARSLRHAPGTAMVSVLTLGLGIALSTIGFSVVYGVFLKGLPFRNPQEIVVVQLGNRASGASQLPVPAHDWAAYRVSQRSFESMGAYASGAANLVTGDRAERFDGAWITANSFSILGVRPLLGRDFAAGDDAPGAARVAVLSFRLWTDRFGASPSTIGSAIRVNGQLYTVVGVMPEGFRFPQNDALWLNLQVDPNAFAVGAGPSLSVWGRLRAGATVDAATSEMAAISRRLHAEQKGSAAQLDAYVLGWIDGELGPLRQFMYTMLGAALCVLLICCANVANLLLERAIGKTKQIGVRMALGASRLAVARSFIAESLIIACAASVLALGAARFGIAAFNAAIASTNAPFYIDITLNARVFTFAVIIALIASALASVLPIRQTGRIDINDVLKDGSRGSSGARTGRVSRALVIGGVALSCGLLVAAGLMTKSIASLGRVDLGFTSGNVLTAQADFAESDPQRLRLLTTTLEEKLGAQNGGEAVSLSTSLPGVAIAGTAVVAEGASYARSSDYPTATVQAVSPGFFGTFGIRSTSGRVITNEDRAGSTVVAVVSQNLATRLFGNASPLGRRIRLVEADSIIEWRTIVGVVPATYSGEAQRPYRERVYVALQQSPSSSIALAVRSARPTAALTPILRDATFAANPDVALAAIESMDAAIARPMWKVRVFGTMFVAFGLLALFLGAVGLYAMMAASVARRSRELGIRLALGAQTRDILTMVCRQGLFHVAIGLLVGLAIALAAGQLLSLVLFGVQPRDPMVLGTVVSLLVVTGLAACIVPALRATRIDPVSSLRRD